MQQEQETPTPDRLLTVPEVAERLNVSRNYVYLRISDGTLRTTNIGTPLKSKRRIFESSVEAFIEAGTK